MAIALDTTASSQTNTANSLTFSHTCTGANLVLFVGVSVANNAIGISSVTYVKGGNSTSMTQVDNQGATAANTFLFSMIAPDTGAHNIVITLSSSTTIITASSASYTGANQSSQPDAHNKVAGTSLTLAVVNSGCWIVATSGASIGGGVTYSAGSGFTLRQQTNQGGDMNGLEDSNGTVSTGNNTVAFSTSSGNPSTVIAASILPEPVSQTISAPVFILAMTQLASSVKIKATASIASVIALTTILLGGTFARWRSQSKSSGSWISQNKNNT